MSEGKKADAGKPPVGLISSIALIEIAKVLEFGSRKYDSHNWRKGIHWQRVIDASLRHILAFNNGEDKDPESGLSHLAHAACCLVFLLEYEQRKQEFDDRFKP